MRHFAFYTMLLLVSSFIGAEESFWGTEDLQHYVTSDPWSIRQLIPHTEQELRAFQYTNMPEKRGTYITIGGTSFTGSASGVYRGRGYSLLTGATHREQGLTISAVQRTSVDTVSVDTAYSTGTLFDSTRSITFTQYAALSLLDVRIEDKFHLSAGFDHLNGALGSGEIVVFGGERGQLSVGLERRQQISSTIGLFSIFRVPLSLSTHSLYGTLTFCGRRFTGGISTGSIWPDVGTPPIDGAISQIVRADPGIRVDGFGRFAAGSAELTLGGMYVVTRGSVEYSAGERALLTTTPFESEITLTRLGLLWNDRIELSAHWNLLRGIAGPADIKLGFYLPRVFQESRNYRLETAEIATSEMGAGVSLQRQFGAVSLKAGAGYSYIAARAASETEWEQGFFLVREVHRQKLELLDEVLHYSRAYMTITMRLLERLEPRLTASTYFLSPVTETARENITETATDPGKRALLFDALPYHFELSARIKLD